MNTLLSTNQVLISFFSLGSISAFSPYQVPLVKMEFEAVLSIIVSEILHKGLFNQE